MKRLIFIHRDGMPKYSRYYQRNNYAFDANKDSFLRKKGNEYSDFIENCMRDKIFENKFSIIFSRRDELCANFRLRQPA